MCTLAHCSNSSATIRWRGSKNGQSRWVWPVSLNRFVHSHTPFLMEHLFGHSVREGGSRRQFLRQGRCFCQKQIRRTETIEEAPPFRLFSTHGSSGKKQFSGAALADDTRQ